MKISETKFLLKDRNSSKKTLISLFLRFNNQRLVYSTGEKIIPENWDFENQRAKISKKHPENTEINSWLITMEKSVTDIIREMRINGETLAPNKIKERLRDKLNDKPKEKTITLFCFIDKFLKEAEAIKRPATIKVYEGTFKHLKDFKELKKKELDFVNIDLEFYSDFNKYMIYDLGFAQNTVAKYIKTLKVFLNAATEEGHNSNMIFKNKKFSRPSEEVSKIYLTQSEIDKIYNLDLSDNPKLDKVRDLFIIGCYTGLRYSDFTELKPENIDGDIIKLKTRKTGENIAVPFSNKLKAIFEKYNNTFPSAISNQKMNEYLKEIGELAFIDDSIPVTKLIKGKYETEVFLKHQLITCHCSRRSFATNLFQKGVSSLRIMKMTGHKTEKVFLSYIRFSQEENAITLKEHSFFND